jgi:hypothetical protein
MIDDGPFLPGLSPVAGKEFCARFDGGQNGGEASFHARAPLAERLASSG